MKETSAPTYEDLVKLLESRPPTQTTQRLDDPRDLYRKWWVRAEEMLEHIEYGEQR